MASTRDINIVQTAIEICTNSMFKTDVLLMSEINLDKNAHDRKQDLDQSIENVTNILLENYALEGQQLDKVIGTVFAIVRRILAWAVHFEGTFDIPRELSINLLNSTLFTEEGILNEEKVAHELMNDESLTLQQRFHLASFYCFKDQIPALFRQIKGSELCNEITEAKNVKHVKQSGLVVFWTYFAKGEINQLKDKKSVDQCRFDMSVESGSKLALAYCLEKSGISKRKDSLVNAVIEILKIETRKGTSSESNVIYFDDWIVFRGERYNRSEQLWIPSHCLVDMLYLLVPNMTSEQLKLGFSRFFMSLKYTDTLQDFQSFTAIKGIDFLFCWPYQDHFMKLIKSLWDVLPEKAYTYFLLQVCDKIDPSPFSLLYGEEKYFDYRKMLMELWKESPNHFKNYVFCGKEIVLVGNTIRMTGGKMLITKLYGLSNFNDEDRLNIRLILDSLNCLVKKKFITSEDGIGICKDLIRSDNLELFEDLVSNCFNTEEERLEFKKDFTYIIAKCHWIELVRHGELDAAESSLNYFGLSEDSLKQLKEKMLHSKRGKQICLQFCLATTDVSERIIKWALGSEESVKIFKKRLLFSQEGINECQSLVENGSLKLVERLMNRCTTDRYDFKECFAAKAGIFICEFLILGSRRRTPDEVRGRSNFNGGRWLEADSFLKWCCSSDDKVREFKENLLIRAGKEIHFKLIHCNQWQEAENFFAWLALSEEKIKELKKQTLFSCKVAKDMFEDLIKGDEDDKKFTIYGGKREAIEKFLTWYLTDMDTIIEFKNDFEHLTDNEIISNTLSQLHRRFTTS